MATEMSRREPIQPLRAVRSLLRPGPRPVEEHLHYDRDARVWRSHEEREPVGLTAELYRTDLAECA